MKLGDVDYYGYVGISLVGNLIFCIMDYSSAGNCLRIIDTFWDPHV